MEDRQQSPQAISLQRFFAGLSEYIFQSRLGIADVQLIDYVTDMLLRFVRTDAMHRVRRMSGRPAVEVVEMVVEADRRIGLARREIHQHVGDFTLFWTGMYPEALRDRKSVGLLDQFVDYSQQGKRAYRIASEIPAGDDRPSAGLLQRLSDHFDLCAYGLRELRREFDSPGDDRPEQILLG